MILIGNKVDIIDYKVRNRIYWKLFNLRLSDNHIWDKQGIWVQSLINSNSLIMNIYDEINRE